MKFLIMAAIFSIVTMVQQPAPLRCTVTEAAKSDGITAKEESLQNTVLTCPKGKFHVLRTSYTFNGCKTVELKVLDGVLVPVSDKDCKVGRVADCKRAVAAHKPAYGSGPISFTNLAIPECENVEITNTLVDLP